MAVFTYKVRDRDGKILQGQMETADARELRRRLDERGYFIVEYSQKDAGTDHFSLAGLSLGRGVSLNDLAVFSWQLYTMLNAGLTLISSLKTMVNQVRRPSLRAALIDVTRRVEEGASFADALKGQPTVFSRFYVHMIRAGEVGGVLDEMLRRLAIYYERQSEIRSRIISAMIYPSILLVISLSVIVFLVTYVLPQFAGIFEDIGARIPFATRFLLGLSEAIQRYWVLIGLGLIAATAGLRLYFSTGVGRRQWDRLMLNLPVLGNLNRKVITTQFTQTLSTLVAGGIPILTALDVVTDTLNNRVVVRALKNLTVRVGEGKPIAQPLGQSGLFPEMVVNMIQVGEETGSLEDMLDKISEFYNREIFSAIELFTKLIEPLLMVMMAGMIGFIAVSIFLPLADLMKTMR